MRLSWSRIVFLGVLAATCLAGIGRSYAQGSGDVKVSLQLKDADLMVATDMLAAKSGVQFIMEPSSEPFAKVNLSLKDVSLEDAIRYVCQAAGAIAHKNESGVWVIGHVKPEVAAPVAAEPAAPKPKVLKRFKLMKADPRTVYNQLLFNEIEDPVSGLRRMKEYQNLSRISSPSLVNPSRVFLQSANMPVQTTTSNPASPLTGVETGNQIAIPGTEAGQQQGIGGGSFGGGYGGGQGGFGGGGGRGGFGGGQGGFGGGQGGFGGGGGLGGGQGGRGLSGGLLGGTTSSIDYITYDPTDNSLLVRGNEDELRDLQNYISMFDQAPQQVLVKVEFITTSTGLQKDFGIDWLYQRGTMMLGNTPGIFATAGDPFFLNWQSGDVTATLRALLLQSDGKVVNAPILRTLNNEYAYIEESVTTTIFINQVISTGTQILTEPTPVPLSIYTGLDIAPRINGDGTITMYLNPTISDFGTIRTGPDGSQIPDQDSQSIGVVARVKDGQTIVLGGMVRKTDQGTIQKFPILGDLPIIGQFFTKRSINTDHEELLIFVTPTIVSDEDNGGLAP